MSIDFININTHKWEFKNIKCSELSTDKYQRPIEKRIQQIIDNWDESMANIPQVSFRDEKYWVFDGNHTRTARMIKFGDQTECMCKVHYGLTYEEEAYYFNHLNTSSKKPTSNQLLFSRYEAKEKDAVEYFEFLKKYQVPYTINGSTKEGLKGHASVKKTYERYGELVVGRALTIIVTAKEKNEIHGDVVSGLSTLIYYCGNFTNSDMIKALRDVDKETLNKLAGKYGDTTDHGHGYSIPYALAISDIYNKRKKTNRIDKNILLSL